MAATKKAKPAQPGIVVAEDLALPLELVTQAAAILGRRGSGKTHTGVVLVEGMVGAGLQVVVVDPLDVWAGVRWSKDGKGPGLRMAIFGGDSADLPLEEAHGALLADVVVDEGISAVLSVRHLSKRAQRRFVAAFGERLYERKGQAKHRTPLHLVLDEADVWVPQRVMSDSAACFGAVDTLVRRGRASGIGTTLISQRAAVVNKDVLSQIELMICHQTTSPQDRKALKAWVDAHDTADRGREFLGSLAGLQRGEAWVWSPAWLDLFKQVSVRERETFDTSFTPGVGAAPAAPAAKREPIDLAAISARLEAAKPKPRKAAAAKDRRREPARAPEPAKPKPKPPPASDDVERRDRQAEGAPLRAAVRERILEAERLLRGLHSLLALMGDGDPRPRPRPDARKTAFPSSPPSHAPGPAAAAAAEGDVSGPQQRILDELAWWESVAREPIDRAQLALLVERSAKSSGYTNNLGRLSTLGLISYPVPGTVELTDAGRVLAQEPEGVKTEAELQESILRRLSRPQATILTILIDRAPEEIDRETLAELAEQSPKSSGFTNNLGRLHSLKLVEYPRPGWVRAAPTLFLEERRA